MIDGAFCLVRGIGPARERELFLKNVRTWDDFPQTGLVLSRTLDQALREAIPEARRLWRDRQWRALAERLPVRQHWRLLAELESQATYLDIETNALGQVTVVGLWDEAQGARLYVRGHNLGAFVEERLSVIVTFNGGAFDLPVLRRSFPRFRFDGLHIDLRTVMGQLGERGGLKAIEQRTGIARPAHLDGVGGADALVLWNDFAARGQVEALRKLLEYNLYDVIQLRALAQVACARLARRTEREWAPSPFERLPAIERAMATVETIVRDAERIVPDLVDDEERVSLRR